MGSLRILCIADEYPWPATTGYRLRLVNVLRGLSGAGEVDLFCTIAERPDVAEGERPPVDGVRRLYVHHRDRFRPTARGLVRWLTSGQPRAAAWIDWRRADDALAGWAPDGYDVVWFSHCHTWLGLGSPRPDGLIVDLDNLEDEKLASLMRLRDGRGRGGRRRLRAAIAGRLDRIDLGRWRLTQQRAADAARAVVVCSELDGARLGHPAAIVIPNGYDPAPAAARVTDAPTLTMTGLMIYPPNLDGAQWFARDVLPLVREQIPEARFRIVGRHDGGLDHLACVAGVELAGEVDDLEPVFDATTAVVVPLRAGSGTRIKVLEAFARTLPVVSTTIGCEGLGATDGRELLVADTPAELAAACVRVVRDDALAASLAEAGHSLWARDYRWDSIRTAVAGVARASAAARGT